MHCFPVSKLTVWRDKEGIGRSGSPMYPPSELRGRQHRPEADVCPIQIQSHPILHRPNNPGM